MFTDLYQLDTGACGTARHRKGIPRAFRVAQVKNKGDKFIMNNGTLLAVKFKDRKVFQMLSTVRSVNEVKIGRNHHATGRPLTKSGIVHEYNKYRRGRGQEESPVINVLSARWPFAFKNAFNCITLLRTMLLLT